MAKDEKVEWRRMRRLNGEGFNKSIYNPLYGRLQASKRIESDTNVRTSKHEEICEWKEVIELVAI